MSYKIDWATFVNPSPDYANSISITDNTYTAPSNGYIRYAGDLCSQGNQVYMAAQISITRDGVNYGIVKKNGMYSAVPTGWMHFYYDMLQPVKEGDVITLYAEAPEIQAVVKQFLPAIF